MITFRVLYSLPCRTPYSLQACKIILALQLSLSTPQTPSFRGMTTAVTSVPSCCQIARRCEPPWGRTCGDNLLSRSLRQMTKTARRDLVQDSRNAPIDVLRPVVCQAGSGFPRRIVALHPSIQAPSLESPLERTTAKCLQVEAFNNPKVMFVIHATQLVQPSVANAGFR